MCVVVHVLLCRTLSECVSLFNQFVLFIQADKQYEDEKRRESEAMKYWEEKKREEQVRN